jgi:hypothetical protein
MHRLISDEYYQMNIINRLSPVALPNT